MHRSVWLYLSLGLLALCLSTGALAQDACSFKSGGDKSTGLTFGAGITSPGLPARSAIAQLKDIATAKGFDVDQGNVQGSQGSLTIHQKASGTARGFPLFITATDAGAVNLDVTLPAGMMVKPDDMRGAICGMLAQVKNSGGAVAAAAPDSHAPTASALPSAAMLFGPVDSTKLCMTNFTTALNDDEGSAYSTWTMAPSIDPHDAIASMKKFIAAMKDWEVLVEDYHGHQGELTVAMKSIDAVRDSGYSFNGPDKRGFPFHVTVDGDLAAISFVAQVNPDQTNINAAHMEYLACGLLAGATHSELPPDLSRTGAGSLPAQSSSRLANLFKTRKTLVKEITQQAADKLKARQDASATLYRRALASGKAVVVMPMVDIGEKYKNAGLPTPGTDSYPDYSLDRNSAIIWQKDGDPKSILKVGYPQSMDRVGLHGYLTGIDAGKSYYMFYIVDPGTYSLVGNTYKLLRTNFPDMSAKQWQAKPKIGLASLTATKEKEFYQTQEWFAAQYGSKTVFDGTYCDMMMVGGAGGGGCAHMSEASHSETVTTDPGGWRSILHAKMVDGVAVATKLTRPFAKVSVGAGEAVVVDGFYNDSNNTALNTDGCNQADSNLVNCAIKTFTLHRIPSRVGDLNDGPGNAMDSLYLINDRLPFSKDIIKTRQLNVLASPADAKIGTFEAGWAKPYSLSTQ
ncbi:MAG TPA: hypothetical protein VM621_01630 [Luteibacter sp.]|uniref:hypothetical protein n=1 Tax=Luteibacter sp. TaxID=1886636 RepID=UPI002BEA9ADF|nr:hypothetical protein [Luteibacter sp.]HVI53734.1 hypothetical protein [Luteibacter sp.]